MGKFLLIIPGSLRSPRARKGRMTPVHIIRGYSLYTDETLRNPVAILGFANRYASLCKVFDTAF